MHRIAVVGTGYVGLVTGTCLAELGNSVVCIDREAAKIAQLQAGRPPFFEPGLAEMLARNQQAGRLAFATDIGAGIRARDIVFIAVGTPLGADMHLDISDIRMAAREIARAMDGPTIIVNKSTVPVQTADLVHALIERERAVKHRATVVSNPEFLREGSAIGDFMKPDRIVIGVADARAEAVMRELYAPLDAQLVVTDPRTAEMIKLTSNAFLATKISFINEIAAICDRVGADVADVALGVGADKRIGAAAMSPGLGFGGSCLPKDVLALAQIAELARADGRLLRATLAVNAAQVEAVVRRLDELLAGIPGKRVGLLGLAFKPNTDDVRESPSIALARALLRDGARITAHDPQARATATAALGDRVRFVDVFYEAADNADALVIATAWNEYHQPDWGMLRKLMAGRVIFDARNIYDPDAVAAEGFVYAGIGRQRSEPAVRGRRAASANIRSVP